MAINLTKEELQEKIQNETNEQLLDAYQEELDRLIALENIDDDLSDDEVTQLVNKLSSQLDKAVQSVNIQDEAVRDIVSDEVKNTKFGINNLKKDVVDAIGRSQTITLVNFQNIKAKTEGGKVRRIFEVILSDAEAGNNVYLYGGAGTGKTFIAGQIADALNYKLITLNCNQFTGELQIIGGQTIEGYQEGRLTQAFGNLNEEGEKGLGINPNNNEEYSGALLLLDELPKLDPNSAGVLNDGLSKIKDPLKFRIVDGEEKLIPPSIMNGRGQLIDKGNIFVIATGNSKLNEADADYEANFKQDLSLQDRFVGSTYKLIIDPQYELNQIMTGIMVELLGKKMICNFTFIFNFLFKLRNAIEQKDRYSSRAFISTRAMVSMRDTYIAYRINKEQANPIPNAKTLQEAIESFLDLFTQTQKTELEKAVNVDEFFILVDEKNKLPLNKLDSELDNTEAQALISAFNTKNEGIIK